jgi:hypothetical protein
MGKRPLSGLPWITSEGHYRHVASSPGIGVLGGRRRRSSPGPERFAAAGKRRRLRKSGSDCLSLGFLRQPAFRFFQQDSGKIRGLPQPPPTIVGAALANRGFGSRASTRLCAGGG